MGVRRCASRGSLGRDSEDGRDEGRIGGWKGEGGNGRGDVGMGRYGITDMVDGCQGGKEGFCIERCEFE